MGDRSTFLFARPSFAEGAARLVDWAGALDVYARWDDPDEADAAAISADWGAVRDELSDAAQTA